MFQVTVRGVVPAAEQSRREGRETTGRMPALVGGGCCWLLSPNKEPQPKSGPRARGTAQSQRFLFMLAVHFTPLHNAPGSRQQAPAGAGQGVEPIEKPRDPVASKR